MTPPAAGCRERQRSRWRPRLRARMPGPPRYRRSIRPARGAACDSGHAGQASPPGRCRRSGERGAGHQAAAGPAPSRPTAPDLHEPGRRRGQPVPHQLPRVHCAAQPRTHKLDAVIPARLSRAMTAAARKVATPPGTTRPARRASRILRSPGAAADLQALSPAAGSHSTACLPPPARRTGRRLFPGSRMRGTADRCP